MNNVYIGKVVNTHGVKGEIRILSDFEHKDKVFVINNSIIIDNKEYKILSYRVHKIFDMVTLSDINTLDDALPLKGKKVYIKRENLSLKNDEYLLDDLIGLNIICDKEHLGIVKDYDNNLNPLLIIDYSGKIYYIPLKGNFIKSVDLNRKEIYVEDVKELII